MSMKRLSLGPELSAIRFATVIHLSICVRPLLPHGPNVYR